MSSLLSKSYKKRRSSLASKAGKPPRVDHYLPTSPSLSALPDDVVLNCLQRVPRSNYLNLSCVSKTLNSLVCSPELHRLRSLQPKNSLYVSFREKNASNTTYHWFTLEEKKRKKMIEHRLVWSKVSFPSHPFMYRSSTVGVGSEIFFIGGSFKASSDLWILDTRTGKLTQGPSMEVARTYEVVVEEIDGKIYVIGGCEDDIQVEVFDPNSWSWKVGESPIEKLQLRIGKQISASLNGKVYIAEIGRIAVYDPREVGRLETVNMSSDTVWCMGVVADVLYAYYFPGKLMWFDAKRKIWSKVVGAEFVGANFYEAVMVEYSGKMAVLWPDNMRGTEDNEIRCVVIALELVCERLHGKIEWSGSVARMPDSCKFHNCVSVSK